MRYIWLLCASLCVLLPSDLEAQASDSLVSVLRLAERGRWPVLVITGSSPMLRGRVADPRADSVSVGRSTVATSALLEIYREHRDELPTIASAVAGGAIGGIIGLGIVPCGGDYGPCDSDRLVHAGIGAAIGSMIGALVGEAASRESTTLELIWRR